MYDIPLSSFSSTLFLPRSFDLGERLLQRGHEFTPSRDTSIRHASAPRRAGNFATDILETREHLRKGESKGSSKGAGITVPILEHESQHGNV